MGLSQSENHIKLISSKYFTIFHKEIISALVGFVQVLAQSRLNCNLEMLVFVKGGKPEYLQLVNNPGRKKRNQQQTQPVYFTGLESNWDHINENQTLLPLCY